MVTDSSTLKPELQEALAVLIRESHMECIECGTTGARLVTVTYTTGEAKDRELCRECSAHYRAGGFVESVSTQIEKHSLLQDS